VVELVFRDTLHVRDNFDRFSFSALAKLLLVPGLIDFKLVKDGILNFVSLVLEAKFGSLLRVAHSLGPQRLVGLLQLELFLHFFSVDCIEVLLGFLTKLLQVRVSFLFRLSELLFHQEFASVGVSLANNIGNRSTLSFPIEFSECLVCSDVVLVPSVVLLGHNLDIVRPFGVVAISEQKHEPFSLQGRKSQLSHVELNLGGTVSRIEVLLVVLSQITSHVLLVLVKDLESRWEVLELISNFLRRTKLIIKGISGDSLLPLGNTRVLILSNRIILMVPVRSLRETPHLNIVAKEEGCSLHLHSAVH